MSLAHSSTRMSVLSRLALAGLLAAAVPAAARAEGDPLGGTFTIKSATAGVAGKGRLTAVIATNKGTFHCELYEKDAPGTVANFVGLARGVRPFLDPQTGKWVKRPYYDGLGFHRVMPGFMIQGGDILGNGTGGPGYSIADESNGPHRFDKGGMLAMANRGPDSAGSQFFITEKATPFLDDGGRAGGHYQIFGRCAEIDLVKSIAALQGEQDRPTEPVTITKVTITRQAARRK